eukprot:483090-Hanusia_phi.AAC.3
MPGFLTWPSPGLSERHYWWPVCPQSFRRGTSGSTAVVGCELTRCQFIGGGDDVVAKAKSGMDTGISVLLGNVILLGELPKLLKEVGAM